MRYETGGSKNKKGGGRGREKLFSLSVVLCLLLAAGGLTAYVVDGNIEDWNVSLQVSNGHFVNSSFVPDPVGTIDYEYENWNTGDNCPGGGEIWDFEALYVDNDYARLYVGLISSMPLENRYFYGMRITVIDGSDTVRFDLPKDRLVEGQLLNDEGFPNYFIEGAVPLDSLDNPEWGSTVIVEAIQICGNDYIAVRGDLDNPNEPPILLIPADTVIYEGDALYLTVSATDPENDPLSFTAFGLPQNCSFTDNGDGSATIYFTPDFCQAGYYTITITVCDNGSPPLCDTGDVHITVLNVNRPPEITATPSYVQVDSAGAETVAIDVVATDLDYIECGDDSLRLTFTMDPWPAGSNPYFYDNGNGTGDFEWAPSANDVGTYTVYFVASDNYGASDTSVAIIEVISSGCPVTERFRFQIKKVYSYPGERHMEFPVYLTIRDSGDAIDGYELLLAWDPSCATFVGVEEAPEIWEYGDGMESEYFDYCYIEPGIVDPWPAVRVVMLRDMPDNSYTPPIRGPVCQVPVCRIIFNMNYNWDPTYACDVKFVVSECSDNTISDTTGLTLYDNRAIIRVLPYPLCDTVVTTTGLCPDNIPKEIVLWDGAIYPEIDSCEGGDIWYIGEEFLLTGDVNLNRVAYELGDAVFFEEHLAGYPWPPQWNEIQKAASTLNSDINNNTIPWEVSDLVLLYNHMNNPSDVEVSWNPEPVGEVFLEIPQKVTLPFTVDVLATSEIGGCYLIIESQPNIEAVPSVDLQAMKFVAQTVGKELRILIYSDKQRSLPPGENMLFTLLSHFENGNSEEVNGRWCEGKTNGEVRLTVKRIEFCDKLGRPLRVNLNGEYLKFPWEDSEVALSQRKFAGQINSCAKIRDRLDVTIEPNPVSSQTLISFTIPEGDFVELKLYDIRGRLIKTFCNDYFGAGLYTVKWNGKDERGRNLPAGIYFLKLKTQKTEILRKVVLMR